MITITMIDNIAKRITAETTPIWRCDLNRITCNYVYRPSS